MTATIGIRLYVLGGCDALGGRTDLLYYRPVQDAWGSLAPMHTRRCRSPIAVTGGKIYVFGSAEGGNVLASEVYDPASNNWSAIADLPAYTGANGEPSRAQAINGKVYLYQVVSGVKRLDIYDPATDSWSTGNVPGGPVPFQFVTAVVAGKLYELQSHSTPTIVNFGYDPVTNQWTGVADDPNILFNTSAATLGGVIYLAGGQVVGHAVGNVYTFTPAPAGNHLPVVKFMVPLGGKEGTAVHFDASATTDADGDALTYSWSFGDGSSDTARSPDHVYLDNGTYQVSLFADDGIGCTTSSKCTVTRSVTIANSRPVFDPGFTGAMITAGTSYSAGGSFTDPGTLDSWTATVDYGEGAGPIPLALSGQAFTLLHLYPTPGTYDVTVTITDDDGGARTATHHVKVLP
jgi:PKD repeat protein